MTLFDPLGLFTPRRPTTRDEVKAQVSRELAGHADISIGVARKAVEWAINYYDGQLEWLQTEIPSQHPLREAVASFAIKGAVKYARTIQTLLNGEDPDTL